jgi:tetratricopeptide (TPR) repeat protein
VHYGKQVKMARFGMSKNLLSSVAWLGGVIFILCMLNTPPVFGGITDTVPEVGSDAVSPRDPLFDAPATRGILLAFTGRHEESIKIFNRLLKAYPRHPAPHFFKAAAYQSWMSSERTNRFQTELDHNIQEAISKGKRMLHQKDDPWIYFYIGAAYGYRALHGFLHHDWIGAYLDAGRGVDNFKAALEKEPRLYDAYLGLGSYNYWRTAKSETIRLIAFWIPDKRQVGLQQIRLAFEHGRYAVHEAGYNLVVAYYDSGYYQKALEILASTVREKKMPSLSDMYYEGRILVKLEKWHEVESTFRRLLQNIQIRNIPSAGYQVECKYWIAVALAAQNKKAEALEWAESALKQGEQRNGRLESEGPFESFREINLKLLGIRYRLTPKEEKPRDYPP